MAGRDGMGSPFPTLSTTRVFENFNDADIEQYIAQGLVQWRKFNLGAVAEVDYQVLTTEKTSHIDEQFFRQVVSSLINYVALYYEAPVKKKII